MQRLRGPVDDAIKRLSAKDLQAAIEMSSLSATEKRDMLVDVAVLSADFERARQLLSSAPQSTFVAEKTLKDREQRLLLSEREFKSASAAVDRFLYAPAAVSACSSNAAAGFEQFSPSLGGPGFTVPAYLDAVRKLSELAPLDGTVLDRVFHATMITSKYSDVEELGDKIVRATGRLSVPGYGSDGFVVLVIDANEQRLFTVPDDHPFKLANGYPASEDKVVPFNLSFAQITNMTQSAGGVRSLGQEYDVRLSKHASAVRVKPAGNFPQYALMEFVHCSLGINAQQNATHNLGAFLEHVGKIDPKYVSLVVPKEESKAGGTGLVSVVAGIGMALGVSGSSDVLQNVQANEAATIEQQSRRNDLYSAGRFAFSVAETPVVQELEAALRLSADGQK